MRKIFEEPHNSQQYPPYYIEVMSSATNNEVISGLFLSSSENFEKAEEVWSTYPAESVDRVDSNDRSKFVSLQISERGTFERNVLLGKVEVPNMWSKDYIGLYCQYAADYFHVGLLYGSNGTLLPFCVYTYEGSTNVCANAKNIVVFAWSFKIFYAVLVDCYRPFGMRRKPWMIAGWSMVLVLLLVLACAADQMSVSVWLVTLLFVQGFLMFSDVPGDGYSVELGHLEPPEQRGQILATGQRIRFSFCILAGLLQALFLNGPTTNDSGCEISPSHCWEFGLTINEYYALLFVLIFILTFPVLWLKELDATHIPRHTLNHFITEIWDTLQNLTTFYLLIFVVGIHGLTNFTNNANITIQYYVIKLTNLQTGLDTATTYTALVIAIYCFQKYLINKNWRTTQYVSTIAAALLGLVWIPIYYDAGGTMDGWFTIFIDLDTYFVQGLTQVLYSMAVIELAKPGQEATTYELIVTAGNAALIANGIISTQLLTPMNSVGCDDDYGNCPSNTVVVTSQSSFDNSDGPNRFTYYTLVLIGVAVGATLIFTPFLPASKEECHDWRKLGEVKGKSKERGYLTLAIAVVTIVYGLTAAILLLDTQTSCEPEVGGSGC